MFPIDARFNVPDHIVALTSRQLHLQKDHPISITRQIIESHFPQPTFKYHNDFRPVVTVASNFDVLGFPEDHPGRSSSDTYYLNNQHLLRTHTSAHQVDTFSRHASNGFLLSGDVYRRDAIDRTHYPVFHQMEGARVWDTSNLSHPDVAAAILEDFETLPRHSITVDDPNPPFHDGNPLQQSHSTEVATALALHLKKSVENMVIDIFTRAQKAAAAANPSYEAEPLKIRWVDAYFPFTSPSWEMEVYFEGDWLEVLGCGIVKQELLERAGVPTQCAWAFGIGLDRIAMLLFKIPDIRLLWSQDERFLKQFKGVSDNLELVKPFVPFSKYPPIVRDVSFWLSSTSRAGGRIHGPEFHENDLMEVVRTIAGNAVEDVRLVDEFRHPTSGRQSRCYRIVYRSLDRTLMNQDANEMHKKVEEALVSRYGVEIRD
jgi:phenylalanyl-tRNA synthetase alpha chain